MASMGPTLSNHTASWASHDMTYQFRNLMAEEKLK